MKSKTPLAIGVLITAGFAAGFAFGSKNPRMILEARGQASPLAASYAETPEESPEGSERLDAIEAENAELRAALGRVKFRLEALSQKVPARKAKPPRAPRRAPPLRPIKAKKTPPPPARLSGWKGADVDRLREMLADLQALGPEGLSTAAELLASKHDVTFIEKPFYLMQDTDALTAPTLRYALLLILGEIGSEEAISVIRGEVEGGLDLNELQGAGLALFRAIGSAEPDRERMTQAIKEALSRPPTRSFLPHITDLIEFYGVENMVPQLQKRFVEGDHFPMRAVLSLDPERATQILIETYNALHANDRRGPSQILAQLMDLHSAAAHPFIFRKFAELDVYARGYLVNYATLPVRHQRPTVTWSRHPYSFKAETIPAPNIRAPLIALLEGLIPLSPGRDSKNTPFRTILETALKKAQDLPETR